MNRKEAHKDLKVRFKLDESYLNLRATHYWFGPHSPVIKMKEPEECKYQHIFPTKL